MGFYIIKGDILEQKVDAIVVSCGPNLKLDQGRLQKRIKTACGMPLQFEIKQLRALAFTECAIVNSYNLKCKKIILAVTPVWTVGNDNEIDNLKETYINCIATADAFGLDSICFTLLASGAYQMSPRKAIKVAIDAILEGLSDSDLNVGLAIYDKDTYYNNRDLFGKYEIIPGKLSEKTKELLEEQRREQARFGWYSKDSHTLLEEGPADKSFKSMLEYFIAKKEITKKVDCYTGVVSKVMFNKFINGASPKKYTLIAIGINMGLTIPDINLWLNTIDASLDFNIDKDKTIIQGILDGEEIETINKYLISRNFDPLPTNKYAS